jgi:hypothetical protein
MSVDTAQVHTLPASIGDAKRPVVALSGLLPVARARRIAIVAAMVLGSLALWTAVRAAVLWLLASRVAGSSSSVSAGPALVVLTGIPAAFTLGGRVLGRLERAYVRLSAEAPSPRLPAWRRALTDSAPAQSSVLDTVMTVSVLTAAVTFAAWFFFVAGSPILPV